jgi:hypothetical protein
MIKHLKILSAFAIGINLAAVKSVIAAIFMNKSDDSSNYPNGYLSLPSDEEINRYGRLAVKIPQPED